MIAATAERAAGRRSPGRYLRSVVIGAVAIAAINGALYVGAPELFSVDLAKGPYTAANNLELTRVYHRAIPLYQQIVEQYPASEYAILSRIGIANSNIGLGRPDEALGQYEALLTELRDTPEFDTYRYTILVRMAGIYRDASDQEAYAEVFDELEAAYPDSEAVAEGRTYLATMQAHGADAATSGLPEEFAFMIDGASIVVPESVRVGDVIEITIRIEPAAGPTGDFSFMTGLGLWQGFALQEITPTPKAVAEFWGRRQWQFAGIDAPLEVTALLQATTTGDYEFDLDLESNYDIIELGISRPIKVED